MKKELQVRAIAKAHGWRIEFRPSDTPNVFTYVVFSPANVAVDRGKSNGRSREEVEKDCGYCYPDYLNDLNAMADVASFMRNKDRMAYLMYAKTLDNIVAIYNSLPEREAYHSIATCDADAAQRAEATLKALDLWNP